MYGVVQGGGGGLGTVESNTSQQWNLLHISGAVIGLYK